MFVWVGGVDREARVYGMGKGPIAWRLSSVTWGPGGSDGTGRRAVEAVSLSLEKRLKGQAGKGGGRFCDSASLEPFYWVPPPVETRRSGEEGGRYDEGGRRTSNTLDGTAWTAWANERAATR